MSANTSTPRTSPCCPEGALPELLLQVDYKPKGERFELPAIEASSDVPALPACQVYVTGAKSDENSWSDGGRSVMILLCDAFGPWSGTHRKLADEIAQRTKGIAVLPDPFQGNGGLCPQYSDEQDNPKQLGFNRFTWDLVTAFIWNGNSFLKKYPWETDHRRLMSEQLIPYLKSKGIDKFAMMGMCYGSWLIMKACNDENISSHVTCGIHYHPSSELLERKSFGGDDIALCRNCHKPQLIHSTKNESDDWKPNGAAHQALLDNPNVPEVQFTLAPNTQSHGFMTRVDIVHDEVGRAAVQEGLDMAQAFLEKYNNSTP